MNYSDAARIKAVLINCGFEHVKTIKEADIVIFDTCSIKQKSEDKITGRLKEIPKDKKIRITGCMVAHNLRNSKISNETKDKAIPGLMKKGNFIGNIKTKHPQIFWLKNSEIEEELKKHKEDSNNIVYINHAFNPVFHNLTIKFKNLELFMRIDDIGFMQIILKKLWYKINENTISKEAINEYSKIIPQYNTTSAYIPISTGCNQFCSFCIVPYARGLEKHFPIEQIIQEAKIHLGKWVQEITLIGQIVNKHPEFTTIIKELLKLKGLKRLRYTSPYPTYYSDELFKLHELEEKLCPHIHIPVQSGSNTVLKKMFRGYTVEEFKTFIDHIHALKRPISITTDIIVGFPWETEDDFKKTLDLVKYSKFNMIYIGIYSQRPGTYAHQKYPDDIPYKVKHQRRDQLNNLLSQISLENNHKEIWKIHEILINKVENNIIEGYTNSMKSTLIKTPSSHNIWVGEYHKVKITDIKSLKLFAEII